jgi:hypothetical protein
MAPRKSDINAHPSSKKLLVSWSNNRGGGYLINCPRLHSWQVIDAGFKHGLCDLGERVRE